MREKEGEGTYVFGGGYTCEKWRKTELRGERVPASAIRAPRRKMFAKRNGISVVGRLVKHHYTVYMPHPVFSVKTMGGQAYYRTSVT